MFLSLSVVLLTRDSFLHCCYFELFCVVSLVVFVRLSVPVQVIDWKDSSPK